VQVLVAVPSAAMAARLAGVLLDRRLVACAQSIGPVTSRYRWRGKTETAREWLLLLKTRRKLVAPVGAALRELHPYDVPELLVLPVSHGLDAYLDWLRRECR
jgi:periplasmic divalent cation tolerance protein